VCRPSSSRVQFDGPVHWGKHSIRGFSGPDVIITVDGARQSFDPGHNGRFSIDPSLVRDVEVLRGPVSFLYGSGGMDGAITSRTVRA
jgi:hemoglobin/transferrin/lactoferrin receptor protein